MKAGGKEDRTHLQKLSLGTGNALLTTSDDDLVRLLVGSLSVSSREGDLDAVLLLESNGVLSGRTNEARVVSLGDDDRDGGLVGLE
jgi:hypothetical protein